MLCEPALIKLYIAYREYALGLHSDTRQVVDCAKRFDSVLNKATPDDKHMLKDVNYDILVKLKFGLREISIFYFERIFKNQLQMVDTLQYVSKLFEEFLKGITYFRQQLDMRHPFPIYHRLHSCGPNNKSTDESYRVDNLVYPGTLPRSELIRRKRLTERCYIERLVYDHLYTTYAIADQDEAHKERLKLVESDFNICFPNVQLHIEIRYESGYPTQLEIRRFKNDILTSTEKYVKTLDDFSNKFNVYDPAVFCHRYIQKSGDIFEKINVFNMEQDWKKVTVSKLPLIVDASLAPQR